MIAILAQLARAGVAVHVENGRLRQRSSEGAYTSELRALVEANRPALIEALTAPADPRARAAWLGRYARLAGIDAPRLFRLIDDTFGVRTLGPYQLTAAEMDKIAVLIRAEIGKPAPIVDPQVVGGAGADIDGDAIPRSIELMKRRGWSDQQFSALCRRVLGRPGLRSVADDQAVHADMVREGGNAR